jgi:hypothetical protein
VTEIVENICYADNCYEHATRKGLCSKHYQRMYLYGRLEKIKGIVKGNCTIEGCEEKIKGHGLCSKHYQLWRTTGRTEKLQREKRDSEFYAIWWQRKSDGYLCEEWLDFTKFVKDISPKPEGNYFLVRIHNEPFGPTNFKWQEHLKRKDGESKKDWWARKRAARIAANPSMESNRNIKRRFGLTRDAYNEKLKNQNHVCAICKQPETAVDGRTGTIKSLAVDHCHKHKGLRDLLCGRCNTTLGKVNDDIGLLQNMIDYLKKHGE